ncbi:lipid-A-disaccharide synthase [Rickettsiales endosymbiont of Stachyamoeba lipophora]|uniref:lipid-A-disaccharide synthase n=1 Tax=Rickettsiales endosymbiont of Stachyamoeba lipophora TaxID=2486578 RepID=UPI000F64A2AB|nr:lipid-A-disaccharide synthase [Rickettsiales endosymbiont of Stachyamoeba lipophora]AZL16281.1 lipid-A-disaccharide synthase [Rickettsiales endosymbiont of Stachyamoeba lipophora]
MNNNQVNHIAIIAGEASGDNFGAELIKELKAIYPNACFFGVGGEKMITEGLKTLFPIYKIAIMGFVEVVPKIFEILKLIKHTAQYILDAKPQLVITIDAPDFNFRVVNKCQKLRPQTKFVHVVAPSVWVYRPKRAVKISKVYDFLGCFLPFEPAFFTKHGLNAKFIGHPITEYDYTCNKEEFSNHSNISLNDNIVLAMPGSRVTEIKKLWPIYLEVFKILHTQLPELKIFVPIHKHLIEFIKSTYEYELPNVFLSSDANSKNCVLAHAKVALVKSGTSSLEVAINKVPCVVVYKISKFSEILFKLMSDLKFVSLVNIIANKQIIPELLQNNCNAQNITAHLLEILKNNSQVNETTPIISQLYTEQRLSPSKFLTLEIKNLIN